MKKRTPAAAVIHAAAARAGLTQAEYCHMARIPLATFKDHMRGFRLTQAELNRLDRVLHFDERDFKILITNKEQT